MISLFYISIVFFCTYIIGNVLKYGIPESLSETAYLNTKYGPHFFLLFAIFTSIPLMIFWLMISMGQAFQFLAVLSALGLIATACAWKYKEGAWRKVHISAAFVTGISSMLWSVIYTPIWPITAILTALLCVLGWKTKAITQEGTEANAAIFYGEVGAFLNMFISTYVFWLGM